MRRRIATIGIAAGTLMAAALAVAAPASASGTHIILNPNGYEAGYGKFVSNGEHFYACDTRGDGYGVRVDWHVVSNPSNAGSAWDRSSTDGVCATDNASIAEGNAVDWRVCLMKDGAYYQCSGYIRDYA